MARQFILIVSLLGFSIILPAQNTARMVYNILQTNCTSSGCHNATDLAAGLDFVGTGANITAKISSVRNAMYDVSPANAYSANKGYKLIYPGDPYRSTLFRKVHRGFDNTMQADTAEGAGMPNGYASLAESEIELIRQWILFDAPASGTVVDSAILADYYSGNSVVSFSTPPPAPAAGQGIQIHLGPFFIEPSGEVEYFWKYRLDNPAGFEVNGLNAIFGNYSHHFLLFHFEPGGDAGYSFGLRDNSSSSDAGLWSAHQYTDTLVLPPMTAYQVIQNDFIDFNTHYINYSATKVLSADVYLNLFTQPSGNAVQIMQSKLVPNFAIYIPNDNQPHIFEMWDTELFNSQVRYVWSVTSHTHKYGQEYQIFTANGTGQKQDLIYDGSYQFGHPDSLYIGFDYRHPPQRFYYPYMPIHRNEGFVHRATYINNGAGPVQWGNTSADEMMLMVYYYLDDITGLPVGIPEDDLEEHPGQLWPNPASDLVSISLNPVLGSSSTVELLDLNGKLVRRMEAPVATISDSQATFYVGDLDPGVYVVRLVAGGKSPWTGKILVR